MAASIHSVLIVVVFAHIALLATYQELSTRTYSLQEIKYFWWSLVTATISLDLPTFLQMPWNMAQRHQTLFPAALPATPINTEKSVWLARLMYGLSLHAKCMQALSKL